MSFDCLAPHYSWMEGLLAGQKLQRCRVAYIHAIPPPQHVLLLGEGNGRFLVELLRTHPKAKYTCLDASARMLEQARKRIEAENLDGSAVEFIREDVQQWPLPHGHFDLIATHFFLDCFRPEQLAVLVPRLCGGVRPGGHWLVADFSEPKSGIARIRARIIIRAMYAFFGLITRLPARRLTSPDSLLCSSGFMLRHRRQFEWGLLHSDLWAAN